MHVVVGDRLVLHGQQGTRIGVVAEVTDAGSVIRWADGGENVLSVGTDAPEEHATWEAAKAAPEVSWRSGITAGVGHEASLRQEELARKLIADEPVAGDEPLAVEPVAAEPVAAEGPVAVADEADTEHRPAAGE